MNASRLLAPLLLLATLGLAPAPALADPLAEAAHDFCLKMQGCARQRMGEVPPEARAMVEQSLTGMCTQMRSQYLPDDANGRQHPLYPDALACVQSMQAQSCAALEAGGTTPACARYEERSNTLR